MSENNLSYEHFKKVDQATAVVRIKNPNGPDLINNVYTDSSEYDNHNEFFLSCLKDWITHNFYHEKFFEGEVKYYLSSINITKETDIDFRKILSGVSYRSFDYLTNYLKHFNIDFANAKQYITYIDTSYEHLGILQTSEGYYAFFMYLGE